MSVSYRIDSRCRSQDSSECINIIFNIFINTIIRVGISRRLPLLIIFAIIPIFLLSQCALATISISWDNPSQANICESTKYIIYANNTGTNATGISVNVTLPSGFNYDNNTAKITLPSGSYFENPVTSYKPYLNWSNTSWILKNNEYLKIEFNLTAYCDAISGKRLRANVTYNNNQFTNYPPSKSIELNRGIIRILKLPNVIEAGKWELVTWNISIENAGPGPAYNVTVNDTPSEGLNLSNISPVSELNWTYLRIDSGKTEYVNATFMIESCKNLENLVNVSWGCDKENICQKTYAKGSVKFVPHDPNLEIEIEPNPIVVPYCDNATVKVNATNLANFPGEHLSNVTDLELKFENMPIDYNITDVNGAKYYPSNTTFLVGDIKPNNYTTFSFNMSAYKNCDAKGKSGTITIYPYYFDDCGHEWYPPVTQLGYEMNSSTIPELSAGKTENRSSLYLGEAVNYTLTIDYANGNCGDENITSDTIVDSYPPNFKVVYNSSGEVNETEHTITWKNENITPGIPWSKNITLNASTGNNCDCGAEFFNQFSINATKDCCGCDLNSSTSATILVECFNKTVLSKSNKTATPDFQENCRNITYTNIYVFNNTESLNWTNISFIEQGNNYQTFYSCNGIKEGEATFTINDTECITKKNITLGQNISLGFLNTDCRSLQNGTKLNITYTLFQNNTGSFVDWSNLCVDNYNSGCSNQNCFWEGVYVDVERADYSISFSGIPSPMSSCRPFNLSINLTKNSPDDDPKWIGYDMNITYNQSNYPYPHCGGNPCPAKIAGIVSDITINSTPSIVGSNVTWDLGNVSGSNNGYIEFHVVKNCTQNDEVLATLNYTDYCGELLPNCGDPIIKVASYSPSLHLSGNLTIEKNPEVVFAYDRNASWKIYVTNTGSGTAYNVSLTDLLDKDLNYTSSKIKRCPTCPFQAEPENTSVLEDSTPCGPDKIAWKLGNLTPKKKIAVQLNATLCGCENRNNSAFAILGCAGKECQNVSDKSKVELVDAKLVIVKHEADPVYDCGDNSTFLIQVKNVGPVTVYNITINESLPIGLKLNGTPVVTGGGPYTFWNNTAGDSLGWYFDQPYGWVTGTVVDLVFNASNVTDSCKFVDGSTATATANFTEPCGRYAPEVESTIQVFKALTDLDITKIPAINASNNNSLINWTITVKNVGNFDAQNVTLYDILPTNTIWNSSYPTKDNGTGTQLDPLVWYLDDIPKGGETKIILNATVEGCDQPTYDNATVEWGCCPQSRTSLSELKTRPEITGSIIGLDKLNTCGGNLSIRIKNTGATAFVTDITNHLPEGFIYVNGSTNITSRPSRIFPKEEPLYYISNQTLIWTSDNISEIRPNEQIDIEYSLVNCTDCCDRTEDTWNNVTINFTDSCDNARPMITLDEPVTPTKGNLLVRKEPKIQFVGPVEWTIYIDNIGSETAKNVNITDILGDGFTDVSFTNIYNATDGNIYNDTPQLQWTTINWTGQDIPQGIGSWKVVVTANATDLCGLTHSNNVTVEGTCDTGCIYSNNSGIVYAWTQAVFRLESLESVLRGQNDLINSFEILLKNSTLDEDASWQFLDSFDDLQERQQTGLNDFEKIVFCNWNDLSEEMRINLTESFEDLLRRQAESLSSNEDLLKIAFCTISPENQSLLLARFEDRIKFEEQLVKSFEKWLDSQTYLAESEQQTWYDFLASYEDLLRRNTRLFASFTELNYFSCQPHLKLVKEVNDTNVNAGDDVKYTITVNNTGTKKIENITINDSILGIIQGPLSISLNPNENKSYTNTTNHSCKYCTGCVCRICDFSIACGDIVQDPINRTHVCITSNEVCVNVAQPSPTPSYPG